jgi:hypothetical protein
MLPRKLQRENQRLKDRLTHTPSRKAKKQLQGSPRSIRRTLIFHNALVSEINDRSNRANPGERQILNKVFAGKILKKYRMLSRAKKELGIRPFQQNRRKNATESLKYDKKKINKFSCRSIFEVVEKFFLQDINSRPSPGKKETVTKNKVKMQKRYLNDTVKNLHEKFCKETNIKISYPAFNKMKPFWVVPNKDRDTCACRKCANITFLITALHQHGALDVNDINHLIRETTCSSSYACMHGSCELCQNKIINYNETDNNKKVPWFAWVGRKEKRERQEANGNVKEFQVQITIKEKKESSMAALKEEFEKKFKEFKVHKFNIEQQYNSTKKMKENLGEKECAILIDFSENYCCKYGEEVQSVHFGASRNQVALHTGVFYSKEITKSFCTMSKNTRHDPAAIWAHLHPILEKFGQNYDKIHFISDSPSTQYRCTKNFYLFHKLIHQKYNFDSATWNYSESGHGKSAADGIGGVVKRTADRIVNCGGDIMDADSLFLSLQDKVDVHLLMISDEDIRMVDQLLQMPLKSVKGTFKVHQLISTPGSLKRKLLSCFCEQPCECFDPTPIKEFDIQGDEVEDNANDHDDMQVICLSDKLL